MMSYFPKVKIIILNWNGFHDTKECVGSLKQLTYPNYEIVVVDNGSSDNSSEKIRKHLPDVTLIANRENKGFAGGCNTGLKYALASDVSYILLINNDTIVDKNIIEEFLKAYGELDSPGILGARVYNYYRPEELSFNGGYWDPVSLVFRGTEINQTDRIKRLKDGRNDIDYVSGCALFLSASLINKIGLFNEDYFLTYEETDLCYRSRKVGYKCYIVLGAKIWHKESVAFNGQRSPLYIYFMTRNRLLWMKNNIDNMSIFKYLQVCSASLFPEISNGDEHSILKRFSWDIYKLIHDPLSTVSKFIGLFDFFRNRFGNCPNSILRLHAKYKRSITS